MTAGKKAFNLLFAPLVVVLAFAGIQALVKARKDPPPRVPPVAVPHVTVIVSKPEDAVPTVSSFGNVRAYYATTVSGQVGGKVESVAGNFEAGRAVAAGDVLAKIEDADFRAALSEREAAVSAAEQALADEEARSAIAREDWLASGREIDAAPAFTLRVPQLKAARAALEAAESAAGQARLDLERTGIRAPFDAIVESRDVSPGNVVAAGASLGTLISREKVEVRLPITPEQAARLDLPLAFVDGSGPPLSAVLKSPARPGGEWRATITRTEAAMDERNQVLYVIAEVPRPFDSGEGFLPVGTFVTAELAGATLPGVHRLPDTALVEDDHVWIVDASGKLRRQQVERLFSADGSFLARLVDPAAAPPLRVVVRPLASFRDGGDVIVDEESPATGKP
ncbi:efflux RND transporter periplasmic adaptor subunit [Luteolibacter marinus]|uniref:efflux RND transporter periplasmic adaptor subunit n=1 Tax=Luteolibacter marinus TaxID=2776705 RepID=UPI001865DA2D|nr:efflux RND transporter periplasmic adaptor subunit [Luteolibacter marinus]